MIRQSCRVCGGSIVALCGGSIAHEGTHSRGLLRAVADIERVRSERDAARLHAEGLERMIACLADEEGTRFLGRMVRKYARADEATKADMRVFYLSAGPAKVREAANKKG